DRRVMADRQVAKWDEGMPFYQVIGADRESGEERRRTVEADSQMQAIELANNSGILVTRVVSPVATIGDASSKLAKPRSDALLLLISLVVLLVGLIAGSIRLAQRERGEGAAIAAALGGMVVWGFVLLLIGG